MNPTKNREKLVQTMFEKYGFGAVNVTIQATLSLYAQGDSDSDSDNDNYVCPHYREHILYK